MLFYCGEEDVLYALSLSTVQRAVILTRTVEDVINATNSIKDKKATLHPTGVVVKHGM